MKKPFYDPILIITPLVVALFLSTLIFAVASSQFGSYLLGAATGLSAYPEIKDLSRTIVICTFSSGLLVSILAAGLIKIGLIKTVYK